MHYIYQLLVALLKDYQTSLETVAAICGVLSVYFSYKRNILVYVASFISSIIYVCLLYTWQLFGDMLLNLYYLITAIIGFYLWMRHLEGDSKVQVYVTKATKHQIKISIYIGVATLIVTPFLYALQKQVSVLNLPAYSYVDSFVTAISFAGIYLLIKRVIENWYLWALADIISVPLFIYKGYNITALQYAIFLVLVYYGWKEWLRDFKQNSSENEKVTS
ncbi:nicotinamide riboside transporter PnuC [Francisella sp. 19X1-34]|uniref:nicotinamide riboside transporter PnuC n=1 Tax=Francisella sp. 19X1-34 TaxID=3087177 RepID=UPI002E31F9A2|nr:nicotinamide riboside transporter PnuC [Francisella sp. 19X1-34]MED7789301.1 nicotinamide riboside transporter PnuC [Francisella sp. 19X1-34]